MPELTREQFVEQVITIVKARFPLVKLARADQSFSIKLNGHIAALENLYRGVLLRPEEMQHQVERWAVELIRASEGSPDADASFEELKERILPMVLAQLPDEPGASGVYTQPLIEGLQIAYAVDNDRTINYVLRSTFARWKVNIEELHETAIENLVSRSEAISAHAAQDEDGKINLILFQTMDGFDASRLLLPTLHDRLREHLGSPFVAGIPNRDILLCFRNDDETIARLREQIKRDYQSMPHQVTDKLMLVTADGIAPRD
ncbi:MAG TPA: DUF1444 family protein [Tepidisphaeraceae bacterium]|jgi:uncharacterized protein YtpQ (UPF0354 family)|nr:DUF1444 family protein [Tepidisphaeraceae bacterium]